MKKITFTGIFFFLLAINTLFGQYPNWENYVNPEILTDHIEINNDIWFSSKAGIIKVDKTTLQTITYDRVNSGIPSNEVESIAQSSNGDIWIGTYNQAIAKFDGTAWTSYPYPDSIFNTSNPVMTYCIEVDNQDVVWVGTSEGLIRYDGTTWQRFSNQSGANFLQDVWALDIDNQGKLILASFFVYEYDGTTFKNMTDTTGIFIYGGAILFRQANNNLWVSNKAGIIGMFDGSVWTEYDSNNDNIPFQETYAFGENSNGEVYFTSQDSGKYVLQNGVWQKSSLPNVVQLDETKLTTYFYDNQGNEWAANGTYLMKNDGQNLTYKNLKTHGLNNNYISNIAIKNNLKYFVDSRNITTFDGTNWSTFNFPDSLLGNNWYTLKKIVFQDNGNIWLASSSRGILHWDGSVWTHYNNTNSNLPSNYISDILWDENAQTLWCSSSVGLIKFDGTTWTVYDPTNTPMGNDFIRAIALDNNGVLYVALSSSVAEVFRFDGTTWQNIAVGASAPQFSISHIHFDKNNTLWAGSWYGGLYQYTGFNWLNWNTSNSDITHDNITDLTSDDEGTIYMATSVGMSAFDGTDWETWTIENSGLSHKQLVNFELEDNDKLWISTAHGISALQLNLTSTTPILNQNNRLTIFPNPIEEQAVIQFTLEEATDKIELKVLSLNGQVVHNTLIKGNREIGMQQLEFYRKDLISGVYYLQIQYNNQKITQPILVR